MDKLEIKQGSFLQQTQYFIPVEIQIDLSVVPARLGIWLFHLSRRTTVIQDLLVRQFSLVPVNLTNVNVEACYLERQKCYGPDKKILFKKQLFDLEIKGQGPMKVITVRDTLPYGHAPTYQILTYLKSNNYLTLRSKVKVPQRSLWYATHHLMVMHPHTKYWSILKDKNVMAWTRN